jgi:glycosyltransferase involved in cell wall biosynthesis
MIDQRQPNFASTPASPDRPIFRYAPAAPTRGRPLAPAVSIVTPFFNTGEIFHETAGCLLGGPALQDRARHLPGQSLQNFEWIIVNDASADPASLFILDHYRALARIDPRIRVLDHAANRGLPAARNTGWRAARAPLVFFLDSDDLIEPTTLEKSALHLHCNPEFAFVKGYSVGFGAQNYLWTHGFHEGAAMLRENPVTATTMVRRDALLALGGFDESIRRGMEDWEFWLRAAALGHWGDTIPEYLDWYRRRDNQHAEWTNISCQDRCAQFLERVRAAHGHIFEGKFPAPARGWHTPFTHLPDPLPTLNPLAKSDLRLLLILPWLHMGGADRFNLDLIRYLTTRASPTWEVTIATTLPGHSWLPEFAALTPDVFCLDHLATLPHFPRLLDHLIASRRPNVVVVSNSQLGYFLLPYLRSRHLQTTFVDFSHMEEPNWQGGGHPRTGAGFQDQLDLSIVVSAHLKRWMSAPPRGADPARIEVCHINADSATFRPDPEARVQWRAKLGIDDNTPVILYAARLCSQKQPPVFARTMQLLRGTGAPPAPTRHADPAKPPFVALVAGDGELFEQLKSFINAHDLSPAIRLLGPIPAAHMPSLMAAADIFFLPSQWEGIALSFYEAMATGLCIVGADVGGQSELVTPDSGILLSFPRRDPELEARAYADTLATLISNPERTAALGRAARKRIQDGFELDAMGARMVALFERAHRWRRERPRQIITPDLALEIALQGVEMVRIHNLADDLWSYRQKYLDLACGACETPAPTPEEALRNAQAVEALDRLESSPGWRMIQAIKSIPPYAILARARFGPDWRLVDPKEPPHLRLERLRAARSYRFLCAVERWTARPGRFLWTSPPPRESR